MIELVSADSPQLPECFICTDAAPAPWRSDCKCKDRFVHEACLRRLLDTNPERPLVPKCSVCAAPYGNVALMAVTRLQLQSEPIGLWVLIMLDAAMWACAVHMSVVLAHSGHRNEYAQATLRAAATIFTCTGVAMSAIILCMLRRAGVAVLFQKCTHTKQEYCITRPLVETALWV